MKKIRKLFVFVAVFLLFNSAAYAKGQQTDDNSESFVIGLGQFREIAGHKTVFGENLVGQLHPIFQGSFEYTVSNNDLTEITTVNAGTVIQEEAMALVRTSGTTASSALLQSHQHARYRAGLGGALSFTALFTSPVSGTEQYIGLMDETGTNEAFNNGYAVVYNGSTFVFARWQNDVLITVSQDAWLDPMLDGTGASGMTLTQTNINVFQIRFQYLGAGAIELWIEDDSTGDFVLVHRILYANNFTTPSVFNPNFHFMMWVDNLSTSSAMILKSSSYAFFVEGITGLIELQQPKHSTGIVQKTSVTTATAIFTIRNSATYVGKTNFIDIQIEHFVASVEAGSPNNLASIALIKDTTFGGTPAYHLVATGDSVVEIDKAGTTITGGEVLLAVTLAGKNDEVIENIVNLVLLLGPEETITFAATSANSATVQASCLWKELF